MRASAVATSATLRAAVIDGSRAIVAGDHGAAFELSGQGYVDLSITTAPPPDFSSLAAREGRIFAGAHRDVFVLEDHAWPVAAELHNCAWPVGLTVTPDRFVIAVDHGAIFERVEGGWNRIETGVSEGLFALALRGDRAIAAGENGRVIELTWR